MAMPPFTTETAKNIVKNALLEVADFTGDNIESYAFTYFQNYHKDVFLNSVKANVNALTDTNNNRYYDIALNNDLFNGWKTVGDSINYLYNNIRIAVGSTAKIKLS